MKASEFEFRHQKLVHQFLVAAALLTYLFDPDEVVWRFIKNSSSPQILERALFLVATLAVAVGATICTWARAHGERKSDIGMGPRRHSGRPQSLGDLLYTIGLASLFPLSGFLILVVGETLRLLRLIVRANDPSQSFQQNPLPALASSPSAPEREPAATWGAAFRNEVVKWGILFTMIIFVITLKDRVAEYLAAASFFLGLLLNAPFVRRSTNAGEVS